MMGEGDLTHPKILIVDDAPENLDVLSSVLIESGYRVQTVNSGGHALKVALGDSPDLILLDIMMPGLDGYQVCERLKADERTRGIPVIFLSSLNEPLDKVKGFSLGAVDYLTKPVQIEELQARLETHLAVRALQKRLEAKNLSLEQEIAERRRLEKAEIKRLRQLEALHLAGLRLNSQLNLALLLKDCVTMATELLEVPMGGLYMLRPDNETLELVVSHNLPGDYMGVTLKVGEGISGLVSQQGEPFMVENYEKWEGKPEIYKGVKAGRILGVPLKARGKVIGVLNLTDNQVGNFPEEQVNLAVLFADQAALAIQNVRYYNEARKARQITERVNLELQKVNQELEKMATIDTLTGAYNRRKFVEVINAEMKRAERGQQPVSLIMLDIDHFKLVNDQYGHQKGDEVLVGVVEVIRRNIRPYDSITRWGGEEFIILTPMNSVRQGADLAERIRSIVAEHQFINDIKITISLGVAEYQPGDKVDDWIKHADDALLEAKRKGRNRVEITQG